MRREAVIRIGLAAGVAFGLIGAGDLAAQGRRGPARGAPPSARPQAEPPVYGGRNAPAPPRTAPDGGAIRWNTPNASGNLGGPGTGGGGGSGN